MVGPAGRAPRGRVQGVTAIDDDRAGDHLGERGGVEFTELAPLGEVQQDVGTDRGVDGVVRVGQLGVSGAAVGDRRRVIDGYRGAGAV